MSLLKNYLEKIAEENRSSAAIAYLAALDHIGSVSPDVQEAILAELGAQRSQLKLIASENYCSYAVQLAMGNLLTDKYSEGYPHHRFYAACENVDTVEDKAVNELKSIFGCDHAYVQPHSGADANLVAFWSILVQRVQNREVERLGRKNLNELTPEEYEDVRQLLVNQKMMGMSLNAGGHLTHGYRHNVSSKMMKAVAYDVDPKTHLISYDDIAKQAKEEKPLVLVVGYSAYPRLINFAKMREIADSVGAVLMVDMAHFSGLVAGGVMTGENNPIPYAQMVTSTTHKTMRGPRGGMILCSEEFKETVDKGCPLVLGGPLPHVMAAKAIAFQEANTPDFKTYAHQIVKNARALADGFLEEGASLTTGGTDNHLLIVDVTKSFGLTGRHAENALLDAKMTINRNTVPYDENGPWYTSGIRLGTPALTTLGMKEGDMKQIAKLICQLLRATRPVAASKAKITIDDAALASVQGAVKDLLNRHPLYPELVIDAGLCTV